jgi:hypothetical protein
MSSAVPFPVALRALGLLWLFSALAVGKLQLLQQLPAPVIPAIVLGLTLLLLAAHQVSSTLKTWVDGLDLRALVLLHVTRLVGIYFLMLEARGGLPAEFFQAGVGDIAVALLALAVVFTPLTPARRLRAVTIWNVIGLVDILLVVFSAGRLALTQPLAVRPFTELPLSLLPTLLVPLIIATHIIIFMRIKRLTGAGRGAS